MTRDGILLALRAALERIPDHPDVPAGSCLGEDQLALRDYEEARWDALEYLEETCAIIVDSAPAPSSSSR